GISIGMEPADEPAVMFAQALFAHAGGGAEYAVAVALVVEQHALQEQARGVAQAGRRLAGRACRLLERGRVGCRDSQQWPHIVWQRRRVRRRRFAQERERAMEGLWCLAVHPDRSLRGTGAP